MIYLNGKVYISGDNVEGIEIYADGTAIYFNPETWKKCNESEAVSINGTKNGCMKWYTFSDSHNKVFVNLLLDHNTSNSAWIRKEDFIASGGTEEDWNKNAYKDNGETKLTGNNNLGPITVKKAVGNDTSTWRSGLNPRLITANEIAHVTGNDIINNWNSHTSADWFNLGTNNQTQDNALNNKYAWLFDRLNGCILNGGCNVEDNSAAYGYWTEDTWSGSPSLVWIVHRDGRLGRNHPIDNRCVRPVITISKFIIA